MYLFYLDKLFSRNRWDSLFGNCFVKLHCLKLSPTLFLHMLAWVAEGMLLSRAFYDSFDEKQQ